MNSEQLKQYPLALGRLGIYGLSKMHKEGNDGKGIKIGAMDVFNIEHGGNVISNIIGKPVNGQMFGTAPGATVVKYKMDTVNVDSVVRMLKECIVDEVDIIVMSFKIGANYIKLQKQIRECAKHNILMIAAAGNDGDKYHDNVNIKTYPEEYPEVISVGPVRS